VKRIYIVEGMSSPIAAFTDEAELKGYLIKEGFFARRRPTWRVVRVNDGPPDGMVWIMYHEELEKLP